MVYGWICNPSMSCIQTNEWGGEPTQSSELATIQHEKIIREQREIEDLLIVKNLTLQFLFLFLWQQPLKGSFQSMMGCLSIKVCF